MIDRYKINEIEEIWSENNKYKNWLKLEILVCEALNHLGIISDDEFNKIKEIKKVNVKKIHELEKELKHDVVAFTRSLSLEIDSEAKKWIHYGLTSTDIVDSSNGMNFKKSNEIIIENTLTLMSTLKNLAYKHKYTKQIARTHGVHAQVNSLGLKFLNYHDSIYRWLSHFNNIKKDIEVIKLSGAVGNYAYQDPKIEEYVAKKLDMSPAFFSTQVINRDRHAFYFSCIANLGLIIENIATEIRHLQKTEVNEICEGFSENQKGSSAMPHKKNPITSENICGMVRLLKGLCLTTWDNVVLWHERDISHSSNERIIFNDAISIIVYLIQKINYVLENIFINTEALDNNIAMSNNKNNSQAVLLFLIKNTEDSREEIYDCIQKSLKPNMSLVDAMLKTKYKKFFSTKKKLEEFNEMSDELKYIDLIYSRMDLQNGNK